MSVVMPGRVWLPFQLTSSLRGTRGDIHDNKAHSISSIPAHVAKLIDQVLPDRLCRLIERFDYASERTNEGDFFFDNADQWGWFLGETFKVCSYRPTRHACLASLSKIFVRFDTLWLRRYVGHLIYSIEDPADLEHFAACLREQSRNDIAILLDGVPEERPLDVHALKVALPSMARVFDQSLTICCCPPPLFSFDAVLIP